MSEQKSSFPLPQASLDLELPPVSLGFRRDLPYDARPLLPPKTAVETPRTLKKAIVA